MKKHEMKLKDIEFGNISAEVERGIDDGEFIQSVYQDIFNVEDYLKNGKLIILGRKGTGKSFFKELIQVTREHNLFAGNISFRLKELETAIQADAEKKINEYDLWIWIFLCNLASLLVKDESIKGRINRKGHNNLNQLVKFLDVHRGYVEPDGKKLINQISEHQRNVKFQPLATIAASLGKTVSIKEVKPSFYEVIPLLKELLTEIGVGSGNKYYVFVDEIDEEYIGNDMQDESIIQLINAAKDIYLYFRKCGVFFCPTILLRNDIMARLDNKLDQRKLHIDHTHKLDWYNHEQFQSSKDMVNLKKLINSRIEYSFNKQSFPLPSQYDSYWDYLFREWDDGKDPFKYIADLTLYRPRDFIELFNEIQKRIGNKTKITSYDIDKVEKKISSSIIEEWKFELKVFFDDEKINKIIKFLNKKSGDFKGRLLMSECGVAEEELFTIFKYGMICIKDESYYHWSYRESDIEISDHSKDSTFQRNKAFKLGRKNSYF